MSLNIIPVSCAVTLVDCVYGVVKCILYSVHTNRSKRAACVTETRVGTISVAFPSQPILLRPLAFLSENLMFDHWSVPLLFGKQQAGDISSDTFTCNTSVI